MRRSPCTPPSKSWIVPCRSDRGDCVRRRQQAVWSSVKPKAHLPRRSTIRRVERLETVPLREPSIGPIGRFRCRTKVGVTFAGSRKPRQPWPIRDSDRHHSRRPDALLRRGRRSCRHDRGPRSQARFGIPLPRFPPPGKRCGILPTASHRRSDAWSGHDRTPESTRSMPIQAGGRRSHSEAPVVTRHVAPHRARRF